MYYLQHLRQPYDINKDSVYMDLLTGPGFLKAVALTLRLKEQGLLFAGLPCGSFVFISTGTHRRSRARPWGEEHREFVQQGNCLGSRFALLICIAVVRRAVYLIENPQCSILFWLPPLKWLLQKAALHSQAVRWWGPCMSFMPCHVATG